MPTIFAPKDDTDSKRANTATVTVTAAATVATTESDLIPTLQQMTVSPQRATTPPTMMASTASSAATTPVSADLQYSPPNSGSTSIGKSGKRMASMHSCTSPFRSAVGSVAGVKNFPASSRTPPHGNSPSAPVSHKRAPSTASSTNSAVSTIEGGTSATATTTRRPQPHFYDLTPVTRNTFMDENDPRNHAAASGMAVVSPDDGSGMLHGEHLAMPTTLDRNAAANHGPSLPPLPNKRATSMSHLEMAKQQSILFGSGSNSAMPDFGMTSASIKQQRQQLLSQPIHFPPSSDRRSYTFTSRTNYDQGKTYGGEEERHQNEGSGAAPRSMLPHRALIPYQPTRRDLSDLQALPREDLRHIFIARTTPAKPHHESSGCHNADGDITVQNSDNNASSLANPFPLENRTWSIPSLHMANRLASGGSMTSLASMASSCYTDDEDPIIMTTAMRNQYFLNNNNEHHYHDDESLSSRGTNCSLYMSESNMLGGEPLESNAAAIAAAPISSSFQPIFVGAPMLQEQPQQQQQQQQEQQQPRKRSKKEQRAVEWLRTIEANPDRIAEAASSKFLTASNNALMQLKSEDANVPPPPAPSTKHQGPGTAAGVLATPVLQRRFLKRQTSTPAHTSGC